MGLFGSKYKTTVATTVSRVMESEYLPDSIKNGGISSIVNNGNMVDYISEELSTSLGLRFNNYYNYGKNTYVNGLPSGDYLKSNECKEDVEAVLSSLEGITITTTYCSYGPPNASHIGWLKAIELYGLNTQTNELTALSALKGFPVYMQDLQYVVPTAQIADINPLSLEQWGVSPNSGFTPKRTMGSLAAGTYGKYSSIIHDGTATEDYFKLTYVWENTTTKAIVEESVTFLNNTFTDDSNYFQARYIKNGLPKYFMYLDDSGIYPSLDAYYTTAHSTAGTFFPTVYFRFNKTAIDANKTSSDYLHSVKLLKKIGMDYDDVSENINGNPDIANVEQAMLIMGVPATTSDKYEQRYLFDFFKSVFNAVGSDPSNTSTSFANIHTLLNGGKSNSNYGASKVPMATMVIQDKKFKMTLNHAGIFRNTVVGSIGVVGSHNSEVQTTAIGQVFKDFIGNTLTNSIPSTLHIYRRQITENVYEEYKVADLKLTYFIYGEYSVTADETDDILLIPVDKAITDTYSIHTREQIFGRALHFVFNTRIITEIKWYQTGIFKIFLIIVAVVISYYTGGAGSALYAAITTGAVGNAVIIIVKMILWQMLFSVLFKMFVKAVGIKVAFVIAIAAAIAGVYVAVEAGQLVGNFWAETLLQISTGLTTGGGQVIKEEMEDLLNTQSEYEKQMKKDMELIEKEILDLGVSNHMTPYVRFGETPDELYNRTIHAGNVGVLGIDIVSNFVALKLQLPDISTIEQFQGEAA